MSERQTDGKGGGGFLLDKATAKEIALRHFLNVKEGRTLRNIAKRQVSRVAIEKDSFIVKSFHVNVFRRLFHAFPYSGDSGVLLEGLTPHVRADFAYSFGWQVTIVDDAGELDMYTLFRDHQLPQNYLDYYGAAGKLLAQIHARQIFHADTKTPNFVLNSRLPSLPSVLIIDCDKLKKFKMLPLEKRVFNLAQFIACHNLKIDANAKLYPKAMRAFFVGYANEARLDVAAMHGLADDAIECALTNTKIEMRANPDALKSLKANMGWI